MSVTELREQQSSEWEAWARRHSEKEREGALRRQAEAQAATLPHAVNDGKPWTQEELALAMQDKPLLDTALALGRTYKSVVRARQRQRKMLGLAITRTKHESDPYDGSDRRGVLLIAEDEA